MSIISAQAFSWSSLGMHFVQYDDGNRSRLMSRSDAESYASIFKGTVQRYTPDIAEMREAVLVGERRLLSPNDQARLHDANAEDLATLQAAETQTSHSSEASPSAPHIALVVLALLGICLGISLSGITGGRWLASEYNARLSVSGETQRGAEHGDSRR